jgi:hypothetical protein
MTQMHDGEIHPFITSKCAVSAMELASTTLMKPPVMRFSSLESGVLTIVKQGVLDCVAIK